MPPQTSRRVDDDSIQVCIIGGFRRAGTRQFADICNQHPRIEIKGEIYPLSFKIAGELFRQSDDDHRGRRTAQRYGWARTMSALNTIAAISKNSNNPFRSELDIAGFKCPGIERFKETIDTLFLASGQNKIIYFFCVRSLKENYLSNKYALNRPFDIWKVRIIEFLKSFEIIRCDRRYIVTVLHLDDFIISPNKGEWIKTNLFDNLGYAGMTTEECAAYLWGTTNRNSTLSATNTARPNELDPEDYRSFLVSTELRRAAERFRSFTGIELWNIGPRP